MASWASFETNHSSSLGDRCQRAQFVASKRGRSVVRSGKRSDAPMVGSRVTLNVHFLKKRHLGLYDRGKARSGGLPRHDPPLLVHTRLNSASSRTPAQPARSPPESSKASRPPDSRAIAATPRRCRHVARPFSIAFCNMPPFAAIARGAYVDWSHRRIDGNPHLRGMPCGRRRTALPAKDTPSCVATVEAERASMVRTVASSMR